MRRWPARIAAISVALVLTGCSISRVTFTPEQADATDGGPPRAEPDAAPDAGAAAGTFTVDVALLGSGAGLVVSSPAGLMCPGVCTAVFPAGTPIELTVDPAPDSTFAGWDGGGCSGTGTCVVTLDRAASVTATFELRSYLLTVTVAPPLLGRVESTPFGIVCGTDCSALYPAHTVVTLTPIPNPTSVFTGWTGACTGNGPCQVTMESATSVTATFSVAGALVTIDEITRHVQRFDPLTRTLVDIGPLGVPYAFGDCAWNPSAGALYMVDGRGANALYRVDLTTGAATQIGVHGIVDLFSLAYHPPTNRLYGIGGDLNLYTLDTATGAATRIGPTRITGASFVDGLAWDSRRNMMLALTAGKSTLYQVDLPTGTAFPLVPTSSINDLGMTYDPSRDLLWVVDVNSRFLQLDPNNGFFPTDLSPIPGAHTCLALVQ